MQLSPNDIVTMKELAASLAARMDDRSPEKIAAEIGVNGMTIRRWLNGTTEGKCTQVCKVGAILAG